MQLSIVSVATCLLLSAAFQVSHGHVRLTFPPARFPDYDFLDNVRTGGPCGVPDVSDGGVTIFQAGTTFNVSFHLAYSHQGGILLNILSPNSTIIHPLLGLQWQNANDSTMLEQEVTLPVGFTCEQCVLQLLRQAAEWTAAGGYTFWSCADIAIVDSPAAVCNNQTCSENGDCTDGTCECDRLYSGKFCQRKSECEDDGDCSGSSQGSCIDLEAVSFPSKMCFCAPGWHGDNCAMESSLTDANINSTLYTLTRQLNERLTLHARIVENEIEIALKHNGTGYVALGWRPTGLNGTCRVSSPGPYVVGAHPIWPDGRQFPVLMDGSVVYTSLNVSPDTENGVNEEGVNEGDNTTEAGANTDGTNEGDEGGSNEEGAPETTAGESPLHLMDCTDIVIGAARGDRFRVFDYYTRDRSTPRRDSFYGGQDDITAAVGKEEDGFTYIKFRKPLVSGDSADHDLTAQIMSVIWSFGQVYPDYFHFPSSGIEAGTVSNERFYKADEIKYHGSRNRGATSINFFDVDGNDGDDQCSGSVELDCANTNGDCGYEAEWVQLGENVRFTVSARKRNPSDTEWLAIGFSDDQRMIMSDIVVGAADDSGFFVTDRYATEYSRPPPVDASQDICDARASVNNSRMSLTFTRPLETTDAKDISLTRCRWFLYGWGGPANVATRSISYHLQTPIVSAQRVCFLPPVNCNGPNTVINSAGLVSVSLFSVLFCSLVANLYL